MTSNGHTTDNQAHLRKHGWVIFRGVLEPAKVARLRDICWQEFTKTKKPDLHGPEVLAIPELRDVPFSKPVINALKSALGENFTIYPDFHVQTNKYGGWHRDNNSEGRAQYLFDPDYLFVKCGVFLQNNDPQLGGGIDIVRGGYRLGIGNPQSFLSRVLRHAYFKLTPRWMVPIQAGDMVCFDSRVYHRSTQVTDPAYAAGHSPRETYVADLPREKAKHVIYWDASKTAYYVDEFIKNGLRRTKTEPFHAEVWNLRFPESYPAEIREIVQKESINIACASKVKI